MKDDRLSGNAPEARLVEQLVTSEDEILKPLLMESNKGCDKNTQPMMLVVIEMMSGGGERGKRERKKKLVSDRQW